MQTATTATHKWPKLDYESWSDTLDTLHQMVQIVGKIRLKATPFQNHSWHTTLYVSPKGFTTGNIPYAGGCFQIDFDFRAHQLVIQSSHAEDQIVKLYPRTIADFYQELFSKLEQVGLEIEIFPRPNELEMYTPFYENVVNKSYDADAVTNFWQVMTRVNGVFNQFRGRFIGKCSPVHLFWGAFDLAVTRFSGREAPLHPGGMPNLPLDVMQEAYSHEVSSAGFWPGSKSFPQPAFYAYCYPTPEAFAKQPVLPKEAFYSNEMGEFFLMYSAVQEAENPAEMLLQFLQTTYDAAAVAGDWDPALTVKK